MSLIEEVRAAKTLPPPGTARTIRIANGVTQQRLAAAIGVDRTTLARWEAGTSKPRARQRARYAEVLAALEKEMTA
jgi:transcriptional regulator with XRE-family HTH domain